MSKLKYRDIVIKYKEKILVNDGVPMNREIGLENLTIFNNFMKQYEYKFYMAFGTLLGAVREKDFIAHDEDIDLIVSSEIYYNVLKKYDELKSLGFEIVRYDERGLFSIMRKGYYIDLYEIVEHEKFMLCCKIFKYPKEFFLFTKEINFCGMEVMIPENVEKVLEYEYGSSWNVPYVRMPSKKEIFVSKINCLIKKILPKKIKIKLVNFVVRTEVEKYNKKFERYYEKESINN